MLHQKPIQQIVCALSFFLWCVANGRDKGELAGFTLLILTFSYMTRKSDPGGKSAIAPR